MLTGVCVSAPLGSHTQTEPPPLVLVQALTAPVPTSHSNTGKHLNPGAAGLEAAVTSTMGFNRTEGEERTATLWQ